MTSARWCIVANVVGEHVQETKHFPPGGKVYVIGVYAGMCESVVAIGRHRGSRRNVRMVVRAAHLTGFRAALAYSPSVLALMEFHPDGATPIQDEAGARRWAEALPWWKPPHHGGPPRQGSG